MKWAAPNLAITANGGLAIIADVDKSILKKRLLSSIIDIRAESLEEAWEIAQRYITKGEPISLGVTENAADTYEYFITHNITPDVVTDQTPAHDLKSYIPSGLSLEQARQLRDKTAHIRKNGNRNHKRHVTAIIELKNRGAVAFDYGNNLRGQGYKAGIKNAFSFPGFAAEYIRPLFCEGRGPFRWVALSGDPEDIYRTDEIILSLFKQDKRLKEWLDFVQRRIAFHGLPARVCWMNYQERSTFGNIINEMVKLKNYPHPLPSQRPHGCSCSCITF